MARYPTFKSPAKALASREARDRSLDEPGGEWGRPTFELLHEPGPRLTVVVDHLRALAAATNAPGVTVSIATLVRPALESLGGLHHLYEPAIDTRERVRRRCNTRLASLREQWPIAASVGDERLSAAAVAQVEAKIAAIGESAERHGFRYVQTKSRYDNQLGAHYLEPRPPTDGQLIDALFEGGDAARLGRLVHRLTSAVIHGQSHALLPYLLDVRDSDTEGVAEAQVGIDLRWFAILTGSVVMSANTVMHRLIGHFGWSRSPWDRTAQPALVDWRDWLRVS
jgi:hypothetical protein